MGLNVPRPASCDLHRLLYSAEYKRIWVLRAAYNVSYSRYYTVQLTYIIYYRPTGTVTA